MKRPYVQYSLLALAVLLVGMLWVAFSNRGYGKTSERGYEVAVALFSACNRQDQAALERVASLLEQSSSEGELKAEEADWLREIIGLARAGKWIEAHRAARRLMDSQVQPAAAQ